MKSIAPCAATAATLTFALRAVVAAIALPLAGVLAAPAACVPAATACRADDECDDGETCVDGVCDDGDGDADGGAPATDAGVDEDAGTPQHDAGSDDAGRPLDAGHVVVAQPDGGGTGLPGCPVVHDDQLTAAELPTSLGIELRFIEAKSDDGIPVDLVGELADDDVREWRFEQAMPGDGPIGVVAEAIDGKWFAAEFPGASYTTKIDSAGVNYGVFARDDDAIRILGVASAEEGTTLLKYDPPVDVVQFPLALGASWTSTAANAGTFESNDYYQSTDVYETTVDAVGRVVTSAGGFDVMRLRVVQSVDVPIIFFPFNLHYQWVRYSFVTACYGEIAHVDSLEGETENVFTTAGLVRRVGLDP